MYNNSRYLNRNQFNVILVPYRYTFQPQATSVENTTTIYDVESLSYECHSNYIRPCKMWCSVSMEIQTVTVLSLLYISDSMDAFEAVRLSMFADITFITVERSWLFASDIFMVCSLMC